VKPALDDLDGRVAFKGLYDHFLGPNNVDIMASGAEKTLQTTVYNGEGKRWDFEKFVNLHKQQHSILDGLILHGYAGIDERDLRYVTWLMVSNPSQCRASWLI
jgi:hypothetical protein